MKTILSIYAVIEVCWFKPNLFQLDHLRPSLNVTYIGHLYIVVFSIDVL
jgi:hypothetical protein